MRVTWVLLAHQRSLPTTTLTPKNEKSNPIFMSFVLCHSANSGMVLGIMKLQTTALVSC